MAPVIPSNFANAVAPFVPAGRAPVGQETDDLRGSTLQPLEESAETARGENFRSPDQRPGEADQQLQQQARRDGRVRSDAPETDAQPPSDARRDDRVTLSVSGQAALASEANAGQSSAPQASAPRSDATPPADGSSGDPRSAFRESREKQQTLETQAEIRELAARDREVRQHEQAHAALGGRYAGAPQYEFVRGPDGVAYAVSGEVPIDTSRVPNDPQATIEKAQQIRRAAYAPAEPSDTDRRVAAEAARMEAEARAELRQIEAENARAEREPSDDKGDSRDRLDETRSERERDEAEREERRNALVDDARQRNIDTYIQLVGLSGLTSDGRSGSRLDQRI
ncbi:putative metalloprotease CJM1_0395 family protein [Marinimicrobium sp. C6131]|uniref:putative metalloprotease CJM1_0395 family protein n=1 Tax=Marinimicrobium sp. C6131 TaxID=3022676 RepID=UPI00223CD20C|nr:putative metalloprotease CJM1_0395 family protein [Marinimicrobium sp. C6131]UZJ42983.1 putative metalloprotease CJM1_0395 family protein [Marinimicrobium sp. C6131]